ncbi:MAG TPA: hypothetical protein VNW47_03520 [Terriglobales bacterium]|jgi:hypothetical protein|nr:hypothetical protein [Terriglobales bacterium]
MAPKSLLASNCCSSAKVFPSRGLIAILIVCACGLALHAAAPPTSENAYCGKGDVAHFGDKDGPAQLPTSCYYTGLDGTPSPGKQIRVSAKSDFISTLEGAKCGDTLLLAAGSSWEVTDLPSKKCDDQHYITVRTDVPDAKLPSEGTRISPAWAGSAQLPGRPPYTQADGGPAKLMATLIVRRPSGVIVGDHYRFIGIEWTTDPSANIGRLISTEGADHIIFDRNWIHPADGAEVGKGVGMIQGARVIAVINSYLSGFNCIARSGKCTDASAVGGGNGNNPTGTFKIFNNYLEASGENILFGGSGATVNPTDIEIRRNHLFKPMVWKDDAPGYKASPKGDPFIVKNNFELKNAQRVLFEGNLLENSWGGFSQTGFSVVLSPKNQNDRCPKCQVTDITIRYSRIRNVAGVIEIQNGLSKTGGESAGGGRYSIHDVIADDIHDEDYKGHGAFLTILSNAPPVHDVWFDHVTAFVPGPVVTIKSVDAKIDNFRITNSVFSTGDRRPSIASAGGGQGNCASKTQKMGASTVLEACFSNYKFDKNLVIGGNGWPSGTISPSEGSAAIRELKNGIARNPRLCRDKSVGCSKASPGASAASDGKDMGADVDAVEAATAGVE